MTSSGGRGVVQCSPTGGSSRELCSVVLLEGTYFYCSTTEIPPLLGALGNCIFWVGMTSSRGSQCSPTERNFFYPILF